MRVGCSARLALMAALVVTLVALIALAAPVSVHACTDIPPNGSSGGAPEFTCAQQLAWGKCGESWMVGYCLASCWNCVSPPTCTDTPPDPSPGQPQYSCAQQKSWGKCSESWMAGYCLQTCFNCNAAPATPSTPSTPSATCTDVAPEGGYTCQQQKEWGKCAESWMKGFCDQTCFNCQGQHTPPSNPSVPPNVPTTSSTSSAPIDASLKLKVSGSRFVTAGSGARVFLNGVNQAWNDYGRDFGVGKYSTILEDTLEAIHANGGNFVRMWLHCDADATPVWTGSQGTVTGVQPLLLTDVVQYVEKARSKGIYVLLSLFDFLVVRNHGGIYSDPAVRASYITHALTPLVNALKDKPNILWEIFNEPEGSTTEWGWQDPKTSMAHVQAATNQYSAAIHSLDPTALVTVGAWSWKSFLEGQWTDEALVNAGGQANGKLDFWQVHYYRWQGHAELSSFDHPRDWFGTQGSVSVGKTIDRPVVIGEFSQSGSDFQIADMYERAFNLGWDGAAGWQANGGGYDADQFSTILTGIRAASSAAAAYVQENNVPDPGGNDTSGLNGAATSTHAAASGSSLLVQLLLVAMGTLLAMRR